MISYLEIWRHRNLNKCDQWFTLCPVYHVVVYLFDMRGLPIRARIRKRTSRRHGDTAHVTRDTDMLHAQSHKQTCKKIGHACFN